MVKVDPSSRGPPPTYESVTDETEEEREGERERERKLGRCCFVVRPRDDEGKEEYQNSYVCDTCVFASLSFFLVSL